jgi:hypothetical protein
MAKFDPSRRQATLGLSRAIFALATDVLASAVKNKDVRHGKDAFYSYPRRVHYNGGLDMDRRIKMMVSILSGIGQSGRTLLSKQTHRSEIYPMEIITNDDDYWSVVFDFPRTAPKVMGGNCVRSLVIHCHSKKQSIAYDVASSKSRYDEVMNREWDETANLNLEQLFSGYQTYLRCGTHWLHYDPMKADLGKLGYSMVTVLAALDVDSIRGLLENLNDDHSQYYIRTGETMIRNRSSFDDSPEWELVHLCESNVRFVIAFEEYLEMKTIEWSQRQARRYRTLAEWEDYLAAKKGKVVRKIPSRELI